MTLNRSALVDLLAETAADLLRLANAVDGGLMVRIRDSFPGHPQSPSFEAGQSTRTPPEDLPDELRGRSVHADPTGVAAVQAVDHGNRGRDDAKALMKDVTHLAKTARHALDIAARYNARQANVVDRALAAKTAEPGCESCARVAGPGHVGLPRAQQEPWWQPVHVERQVGGKTVRLCHWCDRSEVGFTTTGEIPPREDVESHRDTGRARRRSA